eukprot:Gregarina_sp_Poly_1__4522@NODE_2429_length_2147_cov_248_568269_g1543_i0_p1_GENE_NODE_2429_length_2147_cov_248_568269_g1543_i0NODE_2429_length_2147_cov_248_568269_g1543_i0_p1_ORF_typecomplete_len216_score30_74_NODE_2429_length_2147_cov_248_568269_g1543_i013181965
MSAMSYGQSNYENEPGSSRRIEGSIEDENDPGNLQPEASGGQIHEGSSRRNSYGGLMSSADLAESITAASLYLWLRRCSRKFTSGITVIKVLPNGKIVRRQLFIGAKPEYIELTSSKLFDIAYHLGDIESINKGIQSPEFGALLVLDDVRRPKPNKCLVIKLSEATISIIFKTETDRRDAQFLLRVQKRAVVQRYAVLREIFESRQKEIGIGAVG